MSAGKCGANSADAQRASAFFLHTNVRGGPTNCIHYGQRSSPSRPPSQTFVWSAAASLIRPGGGGLAHRFLLTAVPFPHPSRPRHFFRAHAQNWHNAIRKRDGHLLIAHLRKAQKVSRPCCQYGTPYGRNGKQNSNLIS